MEPPKDRHDLKTIQEMAYYASKFASCLSYINAPLHHFFKIGSRFMWDTRHSTFRKMKDLISKQSGPAL